MDIQEKDNTQKGNLGRKRKTAVIITALILLLAAAAYCLFTGVRTRDTAIDPEVDPLGLSSYVGKDISGIKESLFPPDYVPFHGSVGDSYRQTLGHVYLGFPSGKCSFNISCADGSTEAEYICYDVNLGNASDYLDFIKSAENRLTSIFGPGERTWIDFSSAGGSREIGREEFYSQIENEIYGDYAVAYFKNDRKISMSVYVSETLEIDNLLVIISDIPRAEAKERAKAAQAKEDADSYEIPEEPAASRYIWYKIDGNDLYIRGTAEDGYSVRIMYEEPAPIDCRDGWCNRSDIKRAVIEEQVSPLYCTDMFLRCTDLCTIEGLENLNTEYCTSTAHMFFSCNSVSELDLTALDMSAVTDMSGMFEECSRLEKLYAGTWNTSNVKSMKEMFNNCTKLEMPDIGSWDTSSVTDMSRMFAWCQYLKSADVSKWNTGNVTDMQGMFASCKALETLDAGAWDTGSVTNTVSMFVGCSSLKSIDVSRWNTENLELAGGMFYGCASLEKLDLSGWNTEKLARASGMFYGCDSLAEIPQIDVDTDYTEE